MIRRQPSAVRRPRRGEAHDQVRFAVWFLIGCAIYFGCSCQRSALTGGRQAGD
ncbi:hypothetical protein [Streptomyces sp. NPDC046985]|uniref:hypothetical protein n=1 Tax=Streptomyces sp. NPDC046985 TaxID=3155377 RepID=UPI00340AE881